MLGLPSTTEVSRRIPKDAFYKRFTISSQLKEEFVHKVERFEVVNSIKVSTTNIAAGENVAEVMVLRVDLKQREVPQAVLKFVAERNQHKLVFVCSYGDEACLAVMLKKLVVGEWRPADGLTLDLRADDMDAFWDSLASQVVYGDKGGQTAETVEERFAREQKIAALREEIARLEKRCRKEKQINRKNDLFAQAKRLKAQLIELNSDFR